MSLNDKCLNDKCEKTLYEVCNTILERNKIYNDIKKILDNFETNCKSLQFKKGIYIYGSPGCGKTHFVVNLLKLLNYDIIKYDAGDVRNKNLIDTITNNNISNRNVLQLMNGKIKKIAIVMDEIDGMNNGDKGGITSLIKLIRQKKTKKQKTENITLNPIICIGNYYIDKKIKELMKVCNVFELKVPTITQMSKILNYIISPSVLPNSLNTKVLKYIQGDMRKMEFIVNIYKKTPHLLNDEMMENIFLLKSYNYDTKKITHELMNSPIKLKDHSSFMNETDRTIVSLFYHENIVDLLQPITTNYVKNNKPTIQIYEFYLKIMENICYADYIDRITFQNQIWVFNEMSSLIKTFYNNYLFHEKFPKYTGKFQPEEVRFTKILTKYSIEYNNQLFLFNFCQELNMDKKDVIAFFQELRIFYGKDFYNETSTLDKVINELFQYLNINKLDIKRMYRYLDKNVKKIFCVSVENLNDDEDIEIDEKYEGFETII
jgi:DNA polymerase III delta prime subunit